MYACLVNDTSVFSIGELSDLSRNGTLNINFFTCPLLVILSDSVAVSIQVAGYTEQQLPSNFPSDDETSIEYCLIFKLSERYYSYPLYFNA
ncbi:hypothetical protein NPIL_87801 [Nephila pilipes]|uniref:Uncharacterized protein n=1 Tax=Nephila pilipes TaxID=299642 RepID=A0A8X6P2A1_NEPPI|nr:hypothetical protein NPIL_87801 [Nephila pilipes]